MDKAAVVIPFHNHRMNAYEQVSFRQCLKVLRQYPIILVVPSGMEEWLYPSGENVLYEKVPDAWLESVGSYNKMMLSEEFYKRFLRYKYILIYQLDAFVFYNRLEYFCDMDYDYIGAPWLYGAPFYLDSRRCIWYVGNGGFSLRKVSGCIKLLNERRDMLDNDSMNEDLFFSMGQSSAFQVAPIDIALSFSFEQEVEKCWHNNHENLPFGCHAWERYHFAFWKPYIEQCGYRLRLPEGHSGEDDKQLSGYYEACRNRSEYMRYRYDTKDLSAFLASVFGKEYVSVSIWGAGFYGREIYAMLKDAGVEVDYILDNNQQKQDRIICGHRVLALDSYKEKRKRAVIIIAVKNHCREIAMQLDEHGYKYGEEYIFYQDIMEGLMS